jgi:hypothetical protein
MDISGLGVHHGPTSESLQSLRRGDVARFGLWLRRGFWFWFRFRRWFLCGGLTGFLSEDNGGRPQSEEKRE